ncbi:hypothetical protein AAG906_035315 [Vitis piasezkii]
MASTNIEVNDFLIKNGGQKRHLVAAEDRGQLQNSADSSGGPSLDWMCGWREPKRTKLPWTNLNCQHSQTHLLPPQSDCSALNPETITMEASLSSSHVLAFSSSNICSRSSVSVPSKSAVSFISRSNLLRKSRRQTARVSVVNDVSAVADPAQVEVTWQIVVGAIAGVTPFIVAGIEFSKRINMKLFLHSMPGCPEEMWGMWRIRACSEGQILLRCPGCDFFWLISLGFNHRRLNQDMGWLGGGVGDNGYCFLLNSFDNENSSGTMDAAYLPSSEILAILEDSSGLCTSV